MAVVVGKVYQKIERCTIKINREIKYEYYKRFINGEDISFLYEEISKHPHANWLNESSFKKTPYYIEGNNMRQKILETFLSSG